MVTIQMQWERGVGRAFMFHREKEKKRCEWNNVLLERWKATEGSPISFFNLFIINI